MSSPSRSSALVSRLQREVDGASLAAFRVLFGLLMAASSVRFVAEGWVERCFVEPGFFFGYHFTRDVVGVLPPAAMYGAYALMTVLALMVAAGLLYRAAIVGFFVVFTYVELIDVTNYLNHYYLVSLLAFLMCWMPAHRVASVDAWLARRRGTPLPTGVPTWAVWLIRFQLSLVYLGAALAKFGPDWLLHGQPLNIWLSSRTDLPLIGSLMALPAVAIAASWAGFLHDLLIVPALLWRRSRPFAYGVLVCFHAVTGTLFNIGVFPWLMALSTLIFFAPEWPRRLLSGRREETVRPEPVAAWPRLATAVLAVWCAVQILVPLRFVAYGGDVLWHEQGMRWSWKVMVRAKDGAITYRVNTDQWEREHHVPPRRYLSAHQEREFSGQPDLILQLAHHVADEHRRAGYTGVEVRVDAIVSLNGRRPAPLIDPDVDLAQISDGLGDARWIQPAPEGQPIRLRPAGHRVSQAVPR